MLKIKHLEPLPRLNMDHHLVVGEMNSKSVLSVASSERVKRHFLNFYFLNLDIRCDSSDEMSENSNNSRLCFSFFLYNVVTRRCTLLFKYTCTIALFMLFFFECNAMQKKRKWICKRNRISGWWTTTIWEE